MDVVAEGVDTVGQMAALRAWTAGTCWGGFSAVRCLFPICAR
jgi:hypothetical protein